MDTRPHDPDPWPAAHADFRAGRSIGEICARHGVARSTVYWHIDRDGWERDTPCPADTLPVAEAVADDPSTDATDMIDSARRRLARAVDRGDALDAHRWLRLIDGLRALARSDANAARWAEYEASEAAQPDAPSNPVQSLDAHQASDIAAKSPTSALVLDTPDSIFSAKDACPADLADETVDARLDAVAEAVQSIIDASKHGRGPPPEARDLLARLDDLFTPDERRAEPGLEDALDAYRALASSIRATGKG